MLSSKLRALALSTCALSLVACGGGGGSSSPSSPSPTPTGPTGASFALNGSAQKGTIINGRVEVRDVNNPDTVLATGRTSDTGGYDVSIPASANFNGPFVLVWVRGGDGAEMICDAPQGCNDAAVDFGERYAIDGDVILSALLPTPAEGESESIHITIASHLAALQAANTDNLTQEDLDNAQSQVAGLLGLSSNNVNGLAPANLMDADGEGTSDQWRLALINAGFMGALEEGDQSFGAGLVRMAEDFVLNDGQFIANEAGDDPNLISLEDVLEAAITAGRLGANKT